MDTQDQTQPPSDDQLHAAFDALLEPDASTAAPVADPAPAADSDDIDTPETPEPAKVAASTGEPDKRTREGKRRSIQAEIDAETARKYAAKKEADAEETRLAGLRAESARLQRPPAPQPPHAPQPAEYERYRAMPDAPKIEAFSGENGWQDYQFAVSHFIAGKMVEERFAREAHAQQISQQHTKFTTRIQAEIAKDPTFQQKIDTTNVDTRIVPYIHAHPQGDEIMVYLANNPEIAQRLTTLNPIEQIGQIGEIVGAFKARSVAAPSGPASKPSISNAKPLIKPVSAPPDASDDDDGDEADLPVEEFIRRGNKAATRSRAARY